MLQNITVADFLTEKLNVAGVPYETKFKIYADAAYAEKNSIVKGVLSVVGDDSSPVQNFVSRTYRYSVNFNVVDHHLGERTKEFNSIVTEVIQNLQGGTFALDDGLAEFTFDVPQTQKATAESGAGVSVLTGMTFKVVFTQGGVTTGKKVWLLNGEVLPYIDESIDLDIQGATNNVYGQRAAQSLPSMQARYYRFTLPYDGTKNVCTMLQKDILDGDMTKTYTLSYYDGAAYTQDSPYAATVSLFRTVGSSAKKPAVSQFTVVFTDADDGQQGTVRYYMALIDNPFDDGSVNVRWFDGRESQQAWYAEKIAAGAPYSPIKAPNLNSLTVTQQVYIKPQECALDLNDLLTKNYAIIKAVDKASGNVLYYYYYFIQSANVGANNQLFVNLRMDTIQTYYFDPNIEIPPCVIERAHLNRWVDNGDGTVSFKGGPDSMLFERESIKKMSKYLVSREKIDFKVDSHPTGDDFNFWIKDNVKYWVYVYLKPKTYKNFKSFDKSTGLSLTLDFYEEEIKMPYSIIAYPVCKTGKKIEFKSTSDSFSNTFTWDGSSADTFVNSNGGYDTVYSVKTSTMPPIVAGNYRLDSSGRQAESYSIYNGNLILNVAPIPNDVSIFGQGKGGKCLLQYPATTCGYALGEQNSYDVNNRSSLYNLPFSFSFEKNDIKSYRNINYNPKMLSEDVVSFTLTNGCDSFSYDIQKLNKSSFMIRCWEPFTPDITRGYVRLDLQDEPVKNIYNKLNSNNMTGLVSALDTYLPYSQNQLNDFLSNNKNFFLQRNLTTGIDIFKNAMGITGSAAAGKPSGTVGETMGLLGTAISWAQNELTLDNMRSAPETVMNANGNIMLLAPFTGGGYWVEIYTALESEKKLADDYMYTNGFAYNRLDKVKNMDNIRHYFNYLQAQINSINGISMSNDARNDIRRRFATGIRFWKNDNIQYDLENYENWL